MTAQLTSEERFRTQEYVVVGKVQGHFGVKGWLKVLSFTRPPLEILEYKEWSFLLNRESVRDRKQPDRRALSDQVENCDESLELLEGKWQGKGLIVRLASVTSREQAERLIGASVLIDREHFAQLDEGEYYWTDLIGLQVENTEGKSLGKVDHLVETGANDVMVVHKDSEAAGGKPNETLVPWADVYVRSVNLEAGLILVDWDAD
ncbi:MAG: ribosome maturation factor RimM [Acidiferrobacterales bacterium]|nr:ribosome maturation factor RimM [Acidiferrobacterales bacterium]